MRAFSSKRGGSFLVARGAADSLRCTPRADPFLRCFRLNVGLSRHVLVHGTSNERLVAPIPDKPWPTTVPAMGKCVGICTLLHVCPSIRQQGGRRSPLRERWTGGRLPQLRARVKPGDKVFLLMKHTLSRLSSVRIQRRILLSPRLDVVNERRANALQRLRQSRIVLSFMRA